MPALETVTAPFVYIRWLGCREDIPDDDFSKVRINRDIQFDRWAAQVKSYKQMGADVYGYFNNHYQGHSPASVRAFQLRLTALDPRASELHAGDVKPPPDRPGLFDLEDRSSDD
jgi:uncharacterized protein YecE (DUF72 family)